MNKKIAAVLAALILIASGCSSPTFNAPQTGTSSNSEYLKQLHCRYFDTGEFARHTEQAQAYGAEKLSAGVVPHHLLAGELIASFFKTARETGEKYSTVIVLGPNHNGEGADISTTGCGWSTEFGMLECDEDVVAKIMACRTLDARIDDDILQNDHAVSSLIPYIKFYLPEVKVVPVLLTRRVTLEQAKDMAGLLSSIARDKKCLVVGSVDFSHGLSDIAAKKNDDDTYKAIQNNDLEKLKRMSNEYLDSPETLCTILCYMQKSGSQTAAVFCHKSAADFLQNPELQDCTTYFVLGASEEDC